MRFNGLGRAMTNFRYFVGSPCFRIFEKNKRKRYGNLCLAEIYWSCFQLALESA